MLCSLYQLYIIYKKEPDAFGDTHTHHVAYMFSLRILSTGVMEHPRDFAMALADKPFSFSSMTFLLSMKLPFLVFNGGLPNLTPLFMACSLPDKHC